MEQTLKSFKELATNARKSTAYFVQGAILDFTEEIVVQMRSRNISKSELAQKINTSPAFITKLLGGENNFTLKTMVEVALAVDTELRIHLQPKGSICQWIGVLEGSAQTAGDGCKRVERNRPEPTVKNAANEDLALAA